MAHQRLFRFTLPPKFSTFGCRVFYLFLVLLLGISNPVRAQTGSAAAVSSQTRQDMQLRQQVQETDSSKSQNLEEETVTAKPLSADLGEVGIMSQPTEKPWFYLTVDCQAFYNSNVLYASSIENTFAAWQIITTPEIGFAPQIQDEQYAMFFPRAGFRYQFFTYATAEPGIEEYNTPGISKNNFTVMNPFISLGWAFSEDLFISFSVDANIFNGSGRDQSLSNYVNFLDEYPLAWTASWFRSLADWNSVSITGRASYVISNPTNFSRTDNNMTFAWSTNPTKEVSTQLFASYRLAKYTGLNPTAEQNPGSDLGYFNNHDRLDFQQTYGLSVTWTPVEYVSIRGFVSWTKSDSSQVTETGTYEAYNAGTGINLIYKF